MTSSKQSNRQHSTDVLLNEIQAVQRDFNTLGEQFSKETTEDISHLLEASGRLQALLGASGHTVNHHDLMNVLTALRGYAEMLREDIGAQHPALDTRLTALLTAVQSAHHDSTAQESSEGRIIQSEPGFILAVDDQRENRELVARNLTRSGHFVITAASGEEALRVYS